jgi:hypothetical protein
MAITTFAQLLAAKRQVVSYAYVASRTNAANGLFTSMMGLAHEGVTGVLAGTSTTTGVVPTDATAGFMPIESFNGNTGYIVDIEAANVHQSKFIIADVLWKGGAYTFNQTTTGQTPTSYASRILGGDYKSTEIWVEMVTATTGVQNINVTYTNQDGVGGRSTGTQAVTGGTGLGRMMRLPFQSGDTGVQGVTGVVGSVATAGTFNILVVRLLACVVTDGAQQNASCFVGLNKILMPQIFDDSALQCFVSTGTSLANTGAFNVDIGIVSG